MKRYEEYKDSGVQWIGEIPEEWETRRMKFLCSEITDGSHFSPPTLDEGRKYVTVRDVYNDKVNLKNASCISQENFDILSNNGCKPKIGDVLLAKDGTVGRTAIVTSNDFVALSSLGILSPLKGVHSKYLKYLLDGNSLQKQMLAAMAGSALRRITITKINNFWGIMPPFEEQQSIASFLDAKTKPIDDIISKREKQIELLEEMKSAIISHAVTKGLNSDAKMKDSGIEWIGEIPNTWWKCRFKDFMKLVDKASIDENKIGLENIESGTGNYIETNSEFEGDGKEFRVNDIVYGKLRPYLRKVWLATTSGNAVGDFFVFRAKNNCLPSFIKWLMLSDGFTSEANGSTFGAKMPRVSSDFILTLRYFLPPFSEQQAIASYLDSENSKLDTRIAKRRKQIELLQEYKQALITDAVTGKIDVRGFNS